MLCTLLFAGSIGHAAGPIYADLVATRGSGTAASPWKGWEASIAENTHMIFVKGYFETPTTAISLPSHVVLEGVDGAVLQWPPDRTTVTSMFQVPGGSSHVVFDGLQFEAGVTVPDAGVTTQGGGEYIHLGSGSSKPANNLVIRDCRFGRMRYGTLKSGSKTGRTVVVSGNTEDVVISGNSFDAAFQTVLASTDTLTRFAFDNNNVAYAATNAWFGTVVHLSTGVIDQARISDNTIAQGNEIFAVTMSGKNLVISGNNVRSDNMDSFLRVTAPSSAEVDSVIVSDNNCAAEDSSTDKDKMRTPFCGIRLTRTRFAIISGNRLRSDGGTGQNKVLVQLSSDALVTGNLIDKSRNPVSTGDCVTIGGSSRVLVHGNTCLNATDSFADVIDGSTDVSVYHNMLLSEDTPAAHFIVTGSTASDINVVGNSVHGAALTGSFLDGSALNVRLEGNQESPGEKGWRIGADRIEDITGFGLVTTSGALEVDDIVTTDTEWDTVAEINAHTTDDDVATLTGSEALANKDLTASTNSFPSTGVIGFGVQAVPDVTLYVPPNISIASAVETTAALAVPAMTLSGLDCRVQTAPSGSGTWTLTVRDDGADTPLSCVISASSGAACSNATGTAELDEGSSLALEVRPSGNPTRSAILCSVAATP